MYFFPVKMSTPSQRAFACPCLPGWDTSMEIILQGLFFTKTIIPFLSVATEMLLKSSMESLAATAVSSRSNVEAAMPCVWTFERLSIQIFFACLFCLFVLLFRFCFLFFGNIFAFSLGNLKIRI